MADETPKKRRGCLFYGCITGIICLVAILVAFLLALQQLRKGLNQYTDTKAMPLPVLEMSPAQIEQVRQRVETFRDAVRSGRSPAPLELTGQDINALIAADPDFRALKGKLFVSIEDGQLKGQVSLPMAEMGFPRFLKGRYLNGSGTFDISLENGLLRVTPQELVVKGKPLPPKFMDALRTQNIAAQIVRDNPRISAALERLQSIQLKDGKLTVVPKPKE